MVPAQGSRTGESGVAPQAAEYVWDVEAVDTAGQALVTWRGLRLADAGPLPRPAAWPTSLLSVYLERSAVVLGLNAELRVSVHYGQPDAGTAPDTTDRSPGPRWCRTFARPGQPAPPARRRESPANTARGTGQLEGFVLSVRAPEAVRLQRAPRPGRVPVRRARDLGSALAGV